MDILFINTSIPNPPRSSRMVSPFLPRRQGVGSNVSNRDELGQTYDLPNTESHTFLVPANFRLNFPDQGDTTQDIPLDLSNHHSFGAQTDTSSFLPRTSPGRWDNWVYGWKHAMGSCTFVFFSNIRLYKTALYRAQFSIVSHACISASISFYLTHRMLECPSIRSGQPVSS